MWPGRVCRCNSLHCEFMGSHRDAVHELHGTPEAVELNALVHVHHAVAGQRPPPDGVVQEAPHAREDDLEHGQTAAQPLFGQEVALTSDGNLLKREERQETRLKDARQLAWSESFTLILQ